MCSKGPTQEKKNVRKSPHSTARFVNLIPRPYSQLSSAKLGIAPVDKATCQAELYNATQEPYIAILSRGRHVHNYVNLWLSYTNIWDNFNSKV